MDAQTPIRRRLLSWYRRHQRDLPWRGNATPYEIWVSEVMLQQTQVRTVIPYYKSFVSEFPDICSLAAASGEKVIKAWEGLGYYSRARNLHRGAREVCEQYECEIPDDPALFLKLPGVGPYTCAAVQSIAFGHPLAAVDGNVARVMARIHAIDEPIDRPAGIKKARERADALLARRSPGDFNQALMELGALVCRPSNPDCDACPINRDCRAHREGHADRFPVRIRRKPVPEYRVAVGVVEDRGRLLITRRPDRGLLGGLWEFPGGKIREGETPEAACVREIKEEVNLAVSVEQFVGRVRHAYSHFKVVLDVFRCRRTGGEVSLRGPVDHRWIVLEEVEDYAFPGANHKFLPLLRDDPSGS